MNKERFEYLYNTLPWNLKPEDVQEAKELHDRLMPYLMAEFFRLCEKHEEETDHG